MIISSTSNSTIKAIRRLADRKERQQTGLFFMEGLRIVGEAVQREWDIQQLIVAPELLVSLFGHQLIDQASEKGIDILRVSPEVFQSLSGKDGPQGIAAVCRQRWARLDDIYLTAGDTWIALDSIADPGNLGTILRTGDAAGCKGVILLDQSTDPYDPTSIRGSMGAVFSQPLIKTTFAEFSRWKRDGKIPVIGTSDKARQDYHSYHYPAALVILMGSERQGLQEVHMSICDEIVSIPMQGTSDSLNLAVASALVMFEVFNQRRDLKQPSN